MSLIPDETLQAIQQAVDIAEIVGRYVDLKLSGRSYSGLCPFHSEKTPSFHVYPDSGIYVCYACNKRGGVFQFLMAIDGMHFREAVSEMAREAGISIDLGTGGSGDQLAKLRDTVTWAAQQFSQALWSPVGESALRYLRDRGFEEQTLRRFQIGYAPGGWEWLTGLAQREGRSADLLAQAGLTKRRGDGSAYDAFRDRVIFPIHDLRGRPIAFGGRIMPHAAGDKAPKYINSPESPLYKKSSTLYGYALGSQTIRQTRRVIISEGYTDVMMPHQCEQPEVVAVCGTAMTPEHASLLARLADEVIFLFDADPAGLRAAERSIDLLLPHDLQIRVASLPEGSDPHDFLLAHGTGPFAEAIEQADDFFAFKLKLLRGRYDLSSAANKARAADEMLTLLDHVQNPIIHSELCRQLAEELRIDESALRQRLKERRKPSPRKEKGNATPSDNSSGEAFLLGVLIHRPELFGTVSTRFPLGQYRNNRVRRVAEVLYDVLPRIPEMGLQGLLARLPDPTDAQLLCEAADKIKRADELDRHLMDWLNRRERVEKNKRAKELKLELMEAEAAQDQERIRQITSEFASLMGAKRA